MIRANQLFRMLKISGFFIAGLLLARFVNRPVILCFHRIRKPSGSLFDQLVGVTDLNSFRKIIFYLKMLGYNFISLEHLRNSLSKSRLERVAVLTFDDGFKDLYQNAFPILKKLDIPFTLFLTTSSVESEELLWLHKLYVAVERLSPRDRFAKIKEYARLLDINENFNGRIDLIIDSKEIDLFQKRALASGMADEVGFSKDEERLIAQELYLTKNELGEMENFGLSIEIHGHEHLPLCNLNRTETEKEIGTSISYVIHMLKRKPRFFCLPYGISNESVREVVMNMGLNGIVTTEQRIVSSSENVYALPRICVTNDITHCYRFLAVNFLKAFLEKLNFFGKKN